MDKKTRIELLSEAQKERDKKKSGIKNTKKQMSSGELYMFIEGQDLKAWKKDRRKFGDLGKAGEDEREQNVSARKKQRKIDKGLLVEYGKAAPKARTFRTPKPRPMSKEAYKKAQLAKDKAGGGSVKKYSKGGGVREAKR